MQSEYEVGSIIKAKVTGIEKYGFFVSVDSKYNGLVHISEISSDFVKEIKDYVSINEIIYCQILEIDNINFQMKLSIKNIKYRLYNEKESIDEISKGFLILKNELNKWIEEKIREYKKDNI